VNSIDKSFVEKARIVCLATLPLMFAELNYQKTSRNNDKTVNDFLAYSLLKASNFILSSKEYSRARRNTI